MIGVNTLTKPMLMGHASLEKVVLQLDRSLEYFILKDLERVRRVELLNVQSKVLLTELPRLQELQVKSSSVEFVKGLKEEIEVANEMG